MEKIALITADDRVWALPVWRRTLPILRDAGYEITGIWLTADRLAKHQGIDVPLYYLKTFGLFNFIKLAAFSVLSQAAGILRGEPASFEALAKKYSIPVFRTVSPNQDEVVSWLAQNRIDMAVIMTPFIIKSPLINAVKKGVINKHAALLPSNRGLFPYFWARLKGEPQAVSFHQVNEGIDTGGVLWQRRVDDGGILSSMISFYTHVFGMYAEGLLESLRALSEGRFLPPADVPESYHGLPERADYLAFRQKGGAVIRLQDVFLAWRL